MNERRLYVNPDKTRLWVPANCVIGEGTILHPDAMITGDRTVINPNSDAKLGATVVEEAAELHNAHVGKGVVIGAGVLIENGVQIEDLAIIEAGAVLRKGAGIGYQAVVKAGIEIGIGSIVLPKEVISDDSRTPAHVWPA